MLTSLKLKHYRGHESNECQFNGNRTPKATKSRARLQSFKNLFNHDPSAKLRTQLEQFKIFADGVQNVMAKAPERHRNQLIVLELLYRQRVAITEKRLLVIQKSFFPRVASVLSLLLRGEYRQASVMSSVIRDILSSSSQNNQ
jgi:hypothetical protein